MVQLCYGNLKIHLCLNEIQFRLSELSLGIENEKDRFGAQFVFSFIGMEGFSPEVHGDFSRLHGEFGFFQRVHGIANFQRDALRRAAFLVLILAAADQRCYNTLESAVAGGSGMSYLAELAWSSQVNTPIAGHVRSRAALDANCGFGYTESFNSSGKTR